MSFMFILKNDENKEQFDCFILENDEILIYQKWIYHTKS